MPANAHHVSTASAFTAAVAAAGPGDAIVADGSFAIPGEFTGFNREIGGAGVTVLLGPHVRFTGGEENLPAVFVRGAAGWRISGGTVTNPNGGGILVYAMPGPFRWTGFRVRNTGGSCVSVFPVGGDIRGLVLAGVTGSAHPDLELDPHAEKGTGIHAWNIADGTEGVVSDSTFAADVVGQATGAAVEIDTGRIGANVRVYATARNVGFAVPGTSWQGFARRQVAGNVIQLWGDSIPGTLELAFVAGADIQGRLVDTTGVAEGADLSGVHVGVTRALGPILENPLVTGPPVELAGGMQH
ncbi:MAG: hypothetical protein QOG85_2216 [Gaiellaceae bacterium]|nr:hypothetical protein [Gaiellaceae bacterium]